MITLLLLVRATYMYGAVLHAHLVRGESHNQRNTTGEVATTFPPFYNEPHLSHVLCVKAASSTTFMHFNVVFSPQSLHCKAIIFVQFLICVLQVTVASMQYTLSDVLCLFNLCMFFMLHTALHKLVYKSRLLQEVTSA